MSDKVELTPRQLKMLLIIDIEQPNVSLLDQMDDDYQYLLANGLVRRFVGNVGNFVWTTTEGKHHVSSHASHSLGPVNCNIRKRFQNEPMPRTCKRCGLGERGPCPFFHNDGSIRSGVR